MRVGTVLTNHKWLSMEDGLVAEYNRLDCLATAQLVPKIEDALRRSGNWKFFTESFWPMVDVTCAMQTRGVGQLDKDLRNQLRREVRSQIVEIEKAILEGVGGDYNDKLFNSSHQLNRLLYGEWDLPKPPKRRPKPGTKPSKLHPTDQEALLWVLGKLRKRDEPYRLKLHDLYHRSRLQTNLERYLIVEGDDDGRVRPTIKLTGTETLRLAYSGGPGEALQQWPAECRDLIVAAPGKVFISRDYSQLEARILAILSDDEPSLRAFAEDRDIHSQNARDLFSGDKSHSDAVGGGAKGDRAPEALRNYAKTFLYGISYGGAAETIKMKDFCPCHRCLANAPEQVNLSRTEVKAAADNWARAHHKVLDWREKLVDSVYGYAGDRTWTSPFGFRRRFWEPFNEGKRSLMNFPMQHCLPPETRILTRAGWTPIGEFAMGEVWTGAEWAPARRLNMGEQSLFNVALSDGRNIRCSPDHQFLMADTWPFWCRADEISPGMRPSLDTHTKWGLELFDDEHWYWAGRLMGDGWVRANGFWGIVFNQKEREDAKRFCEWLDRQDLKNLTHKWKQGYHVEEKQNSIRVVLASQDSHRLWKSWGFWAGVKARTKRVPPVVFSLNESRRAQFLLGWYDADGTKFGRGGVEFEGRKLLKLTSVSPGACEDLVHLSRTVGLRAGFYNKLYQDPQKGHRGWYNVFFLQRDEPVYVAATEYLGSSVGMFTLEVDHPRHAYSTEGLISKNCASQIVNRAMIQLHQLGAPIVLQMHDELVLEVEEGKAEVAMEQLRVVMEQPIPELGGAVFPTKGGISGTWGGLK